MSGGYDRKELNVARWVADRSRRSAEARERLDGLVDPVARVVLELHASVEHWVGDVCQGCPASGEHSDDYQPWPCTTVRAVAEVFGIDIPPDTGWADDPDFDPHAPVPGYPTHPHEGASS